MPDFKPIAAQAVRFALGSGPLGLMALGFAVVAGAVAHQVINRAGAVRRVRLGDWLDVEFDPPPSTPPGPEDFSGRF